MAPRRLPFVIAGLVLGVLIAVIVASQGCSGDHKKQHAGGGYIRSQTVAAVPHIVRGPRRRHLRLVTISRLIDGRY